LASITDVTARFGLDEGFVAKRLKLGRLTPESFGPIAWRKGSPLLLSKVELAVRALRGSYTC